jgi:hypothetical protein
VNLKLINKMVALIVEFQGIGVEEFIMSTKFQDQILHVAPTAIKLDIRSMNVHLLKICAIVLCGNAQVYKYNYYSSICVNTNY